MREAWSRLLGLLLAVLLFSCAATSPYASDYPLTMEGFTTRDGVVSGRVPQGWFSAADDSLGTALSAWFVRDDLAAALSLNDFVLDALSAERVSREGLLLAARLSAAFRMGSSIAPPPLPTEFQVAGKPYCGYELSTTADERRIVVFAAKGKYYECEVRAVKGRWAAEDLRKLYSVQQSFLASLRY